MLVGPSLTTLMKALVLHLAPLLQSDLMLNATSLYDAGGSSAGPFVNAEYSGSITTGTNSLGQPTYTFSGGIGDKDGQGLAIGTSHGETVIHEW